MTDQLTIGGTDIEKGDTVTVTLLKDGEEATGTFDVTGEVRDKPQFVVSYEGQSVGTLREHVPIGSHREDAAVVGSLSFDHEEGVVRPVIDVEVA